MRDQKAGRQVECFAPLEADQSRRFTSLVWSRQAWPRERAELMGISAVLNRCLLAGISSHVLY